MQETMTAEVRVLLAAIRDALSPPSAAMYDGLAVRERMIARRADYMAGVLGQAVESGHLPGAAIFQRMAAEPLGYEPMPEGGKS